MKHAVAVRDMAIKTGLNVVLGCGWYRETYYEPRLWRMKTDEIAEEMVRDLTEGIDGTDVRAGVIGEIGAHFNWLSAIEERVLRAAARAQLKTDVALTTHATRGPQGLEQLDVLQTGGRRSQARRDSPLRELSQAQVSHRDRQAGSVHLLRPDGWSEDCERVRPSEDAPSH